jgi:hypothetical protein
MVQAVVSSQTISRATWDEALAEVQSPPPLLQSWGYGEVQAREGWTVERLVLPGGAQATLLLKGSGPLRWAYCPRGPVPATADAVAELADWARRQRLARLRVEPEAPIALGGELRLLGFRPAAEEVHPRHTLLVPLGPPDEMLDRLKPKHRYNVRLAERRGVLVEVGEDAVELKRQSEGTERRQGISLPSVELYQHRLELLEWCRIYVARYRGEALAAIMVARFAGRSYYLFGGACGRHLNLMPTYAVQWAAMVDAYQAGCRDYDLWGIPPSRDPSHPWHGLWQFKSGFGGRVVEYCGVWDLVLSPVAARLDHLATRARRAARRLRAEAVPMGRVLGRDHPGV